MKAKLFAKLFKAMSACALAASLGAASAASVAWADDAIDTKVSGTDHYGAVEENGQIDSLLVQANQGTQLFVSVFCGKQPVIKDFKQPVNAANGEPELIRLSAAGVDLGKLDAYTIEVKEGSPNGNVVYTGSFQPVYGSMDGAKTLIGVRTLATDGSEQTRAFEAPATFYYDGGSYQLTSQQPDSEGVYRYKRFDAAQSVTGRIVYVDQAGVQIRETPIDGITADKPTLVTLPTLIEKLSDDNKTTTYYRVVSATRTLQVSYPGQTEFVVRCVQMNFGESSVGTQSSYVAKIDYYDTTNAQPGEEGELIMSDTLTVTKDFIYTVPQEFSQMRTMSNADGSDAHQAMVTYGLCANQDSSAVAGNGKITINAEEPYGVTSESEGEKHFRVNYQVENNPDVTSRVDYVVRYINAAPNSSTSGSVLGTQEVTVTREEGVKAIQPEPSFTVDGVKLLPYGTKFEVKFSTTANPVYDIYYVPEGYTAVDSYEVTVNYQDIATGKVLQTAKATIEPTAAGEVLIGPAPETIQFDGVNYVRLDGQDQAISHQYFTPARVYTIYYRDSRDTQYGNTVIRRTVTRYIDDATGAVQPGTEPAAGQQDGTAQASLTDAGNQLSAVDDGAGTGALLNNEGVDSASVRELNDEATPLAQYKAQADGADGESALSGSLSAGAIAGIAAGVLAVAGGLFLFFYLRKRRTSEEEARS